MPITTVSESHRFPGELSQTGQVKPNPSRVVPQKLRQEVEKVVRIVKKIWKNVAYRAGKVVYRLGFHIFKRVNRQVADYCEIKLSDLSLKIAEISVFAHIKWFKEKRIFPAPSTVNPSILFDQKKCDAIQNEVDRLTRGGDRIVVNKDTIATILKTGKCFGTVTDTLTNFAKGKFSSFEEVCQKGGVLQSIALQAIYEATKPPPERAHIFVINKLLETYPAAPQIQKIIDETPDIEKSTTSDIFATKMIIHLCLSQLQSGPIPPSEKEKIKQIRFLLSQLDFQYALLEKESLLEEDNPFKKLFEESQRNSPTNILDEMLRCSKSHKDPLQSCKQLLTIFSMPFTKVIKGGSSCIKPLSSIFRKLILYNLDDIFSQARISEYFAPHKMSIHNALENLPLATRKSDRELIEQMTQLKSGTYGVHLRTEESRHLIGMVKHGSGIVEVLDPGWGFFRFTDAKDFEDNFPQLLSLHPEPEQRAPFYQEGVPNHSLSVFRIEKEPSKKPA